MQVKVWGSVLSYDRTSYPQISLLRHYLVTPSLSLPHGYPTSLSQLLAIPPLEVLASSLHLFLSLPLLLSTFSTPFLCLQSSPLSLHTDYMPSLGHPGSILLLARSRSSYKLSIALSFSFPYLCPTSFSPTCPHTLGTYCFKGRFCHSTFEWVLPMGKCPTLHSRHTLRLLLPAPALPTPSHTFPPTLLSLSLSPLPHAILTLLPNLLPIASPLLPVVVSSAFATLPPFHLPHMLCFCPLWPRRSIWTAP